MTNSNSVREELFTMDETERGRERGREREREMAGGGAGGGRH